MAKLNSKQVLEGAMKGGDPLVKLTNLTELLGEIRQLQADIAPLRADLIRELQADDRSLRWIGKKLDVSWQSLYQVLERDEAKKGKAQRGSQAV